MRWCRCRLRKVRGIAGICLACLGLIPGMPRPVPPASHHARVAIMAPAEEHAELPHPAEPEVTMPVAGTIAEQAPHHEVSFYDQAAAI